MKFGHEYSQLLASEGFPASWVSSAISYRELKKCIKKVQHELLAVGLDAGTLQQLPSVFGVSTPEDKDGPLCATVGTACSFVPELWIAVDKQTGSLLDAGLTEHTKEHLSRLNPQLLAASNGSAGTSITGDPSSLAAQLERKPSMETGIRWVKVPLATAANFFSLLDPKLAELDALQQAEERRLQGMMVGLGDTLSQLTAPSGKHGKYKPQVDTEIWREILALYVDSTVFFSSLEQDHGSRTFVQAKSQLASFSEKLVSRDLVRKFKSPQSPAAFAQFVSINLDILKAMRFQEINNEAVRKILKKFDKRTALGAAKAYQGLILSGPFAKSIATDMCAAISSKVVAVVPQMDDFICPICYGLAWRPIRLGCCNSIYCIRCVIQLQKGGKDECPMCRKESIMKATAGESCLLMRKPHRVFNVYLSANIDNNTAAFLTKYFPKEVKERQKANERAATIDKYGEEFYRNTCAIM